MILHKIADFDPDYRTHFDDQDIISYDLYVGTEKAGSVDDILVDENGSIRYLVINTGIWVFGKKVLMPVGSARINYAEHRIYADGLTRDQVEALPKYESNEQVDYDYEERVRGVYRPNSTAVAPMETSASMDAAAVAAPSYNRDTYSYENDAPLYNVDEQKHQNLRLYEERLVAGKTRRKSGEVAVGKRVETETTRVAVPIEKERVVIERVTSTDVGMAVAPGSDAFQEGEVARVEVYEETPDIRKEAFVREEVSIRKEVDHETVETQETLRKEQLDVDTDGNPVVDRTSDRR